MCHILGIEPQFENIIKNGPFIPMTAGQRKPEGHWATDERKAANLDQRLKSLLMFVLPNDQINYVINCLTTKSTWDDLILYHEGPYDVKESRVMDLKLCYNTFKFKEGETLTQTFTRYKALMNELVNDGIKLSKIEINIGFIIAVTKEWQSFCQSDDEEDTRSSHEYINNLEEEYQARALLAKSKDSSRRVLKGSAVQKKLTKLNATNMVRKVILPTKYFEAEYNKVKAKLALLSLSASASKAATVKNKGLIAEDYEWDEEEVSSDDKEIVEVKVHMALAEKNDAVSKEGSRNGKWVKIFMRKVHTLLEMKDNDDRKTYLDYLCIYLNYVEEQRNTLLSKHKDLIHELNACKEHLLVLKQEKLDFLTMQHVNSDILKENKNLRTELKVLTIITKTWLNSSNKVNQCISKKIPSQKKRILRVYQLTKDLSSSRQKDLVFVKSSADDTKVSIPGVERPWLSEPEGFILPNHDTGRILTAESQRNTTNPSVVVTDFSATKYDSADESSVCSNPLPPLKKLDGVEPISGSKTIKSILRSKSTFKAKTLKGVKINEPSSAPAKGHKNSSASKVNSAPVGKLKSVKIKDDHPLAIVIKELNDLKLQFSKNQSSYSRNNQQYERTDHKTCDHAEYISTMNILCGSYDHDTNGHNRIISLEREINLRNPQHAFKRCEACGSLTHTTTDHYDIEWFKRGEVLQAKKTEALKLTRAKSFNDNRSKTPTRSGCSRHMTGVKSYLHKYEEQPGPKAVFGDESTCVTKGYGSIKCNGIVFTKVAFVNGLKYNLISISQLCDAKYIVQFDEKSGTIFNSNKEIVMIAQRHKRLAHLNFKTINKLAKQNIVIGLPSLVYSKDKTCSSCEKGKHQRDHFKTKQTSSIKKCLHLLHMDLFGLVTPRSINHEKYTLVIVNEYSRYTLVFLEKKCQAPETIMSFIKRVENQNDIKVKQLRTDNGTEFRNSILVNFCDERGISQNFSSPYTPKQNGVAERRNRTLIEAARTMLLGYVFSKQYWTEARISNINFLHVFGCPVYIHNHKDHLGKFDEKVDDGYLLGYSLVSKAFRVFNTRRQQTEETYHITFDESPDAIKFSKPSIDNINIAKNKRYPPDEYLHPYEPSQRYQTNNNDVSFIEPYECPETVVLETEVSSDQNGVRMLTRAMSKQLGTSSAHECLFVDFLSKEEPKKQEGIDYDETFAPVARLKAIRIFLAFSTYMNFIVYQMDVKSAFLNGKLKEEVYVKQPPGFKSNEFPNHVFKLDKALYGLKQAPRAWYETLSTFLTEHKFVRGKIDNILFVYKTQTDVILVQIYIDDIIFGSTNTKLCKQFAKLMTQRYEMSMMGVLTYFLGFPIKQSERGHDLSGKAVNETQYRGFDLKGYSDSDYARCNMDRKSTSGAC
ncbi:retrovirus-related pol polyprotein from transposon TNT 1-94 [Tanacetum coccineum]